MIQADEVVLVDAVGRMDQQAAHCETTQRTRPGIRTNSCCDHPRSTKPWTVAQARRLGKDSGHCVAEVNWVLPDIRHGARNAGVVLEDECPTFRGRGPDGPADQPTEPPPSPAEVPGWVWVARDDLEDTDRTTHFAFSPGAVARLALLTPSTALPGTLRRDRLVSGPKARR